MKSRLVAVLALALAAGLLSQCTKQFTDGRTTMVGPTVRPGEAPIGASQRIPANDTRTAAASTDLTTWRIDPNAPKQSNGGSGSEVAPPLDQPAR